MSQIHPCLPLRILATGKAVPPACVTSVELDRRLGRARGWTQRKSGVRHRHFADDALPQSELAAKALVQATDRAGVRLDSIDLVLSTAAIAEQALPAMALAVAARAGVPDGVPAFDVNASCLGFVVALHMAAGLLATGSYRRIAIVASDLPSRGVDWRVPEASLIFGDGAAAAIVELPAAGDRAGILGYRMESWPAGRELCEIRAGGTRRTPRTGIDDDDFLFRMDGPELFRGTLAVIDGFMARLFVDALALGDMHKVVPHQASHLAMKHLARHLRLPAERIVDIYATHGNQVSASLPTALHEAFISAAVHPGDRILLLGTAAGISVCGMVLQL